ncbi:MAG: class I SAM-dependent methyltransferase [Pseudomonas sp.]|uniref:class I SAM-dependent methyltransferase n=1 Tax=Pseudomonas sp. TaxID=306 RepID=UPI0033949658
MKASDLLQVARQLDEEILDLFPESAEASRVSLDLDRIGLWSGLNRQLYGHIARRSLRLADARQGLKVLDACCGRGGLTRYLWSRLSRTREPGQLDVYGVDWSERHIANATREAPAIHWLRRDMFQSGFASGEFDVLVCSQSLHHFTPAQIPQLLREFCRIARDVYVFDLRQTRYGSLWMRLIAPFFSAEFIHDGLVSHRRALSVEQVRGLLREHALPYRLQTFTPLGMLLEVQS